jgi:hypothetical protein
VTRCSRALELCRFRFELGPDAGGQVFRATRIEQNTRLGVADFSRPFLTDKRRRPGLQRSAFALHGKDVSAQIAPG